MNFFSRAHLTSACLAVAAIAALSSPVQAQDLVAEGENIFKKCQSCHAVGEGARNKVGPVLNGMFGRAAGTLEDYTRYSAAMVTAGENGLIWTPEIFNEYIEAPREYVDGTKMTYRGLPDEEDRAALTAYLLTFSPDYVPEEMEPAE